MLHVKPLNWGQAVRQTRDERLLTQREAAEELGVAIRTLQSWEHGEDVIPHPRHRRAILAWLTREEAA